MAEKNELNNKSDLKAVDATNASKELAQLYGRKWIPSVLVWSGIVLAVVTVVLIVFSQNLPPASITLGEEILTASLAVLFASLGIALQTVSNGMRIKLALETLKIRAENKMLHDERMAKLKQLSPSTKAADLESPAKVNLYGILAISSER